MNQKRWTYHLLFTFVGFRRSCDLEKVKNIDNNFFSWLEILMTVHSPIKLGVRAAPDVTISKWNKGTHE